MLLPPNMLCSIWRRQLNQSRAAILRAAGGTRSEGFINNHPEPVKLKMRKHLCQTDAFGDAVKNWFCYKFREDANHLCWSAKNNPTEQNLKQNLG